MPRIALAALATTALAISATPAGAVAYFTATLSFDQEVPPPPLVPSPGTGTGTAVFDEIANTLAVSLDFADLLAPTLDGHIHCCAGPDGNAPVAIGFTPAGFPLGVTEGGFEAVFDLLDPGIYSAAFLAASGGTAESARDRLISNMADERAYFNIHTPARPAGEIRGNIMVPEPAALALFGLGVLALGLARRRA